MKYPINIEKWMNEAKDQTINNGPFMDLIRTTAELANDAYRAGVEDGKKQISDRDKICKLWTDVFDKLEISWKHYKRDIFISSDFYLPDQKCYFKVLYKDDYSKLDDYIRRAKIYPFPMVFGHSDGTFQILDADQEYLPAYFYSRDETWLSQCTECGKYFFLQSCGSYQCRVCSVYDGDQYLGKTYYGKENLFRILGEK